MNYVWTAFANLAAALIAGFGVCFFLAHQRSSRLRVQLAQLIRLVEGVDEDEQEAIWLDEADRRKQWEETLSFITADVEKGADRLVRLNAQSKRELERLLLDLHQVDTKTVLHVLGYAEEDAPKPPTTQEKALERIRNYRQRIGVFSFFEKGW